MTEDDQQEQSAPLTPESGPAGAADELEQWKTQAAENWDKFLRAAADLDNYRKRAAREREELPRATRERVVTALLPVLDNLERAIAAAGKTPAKSAALLEGITQVHSQFKRVLEDLGLQEVVAQAGHPFDPNLHEAVGHVESDEHPEGTILDQLQRGYKLTERLLRPARVMVSKGPAPNADADETDDAPPK